MVFLAAFIYVTASFFIVRSHGGYMAKRKKPGSGWRKLDLVELQVFTGYTREQILDVLVLSDNPFWYWKLGELRSYKNATKKGLQIGKGSGFVNFGRIKKYLDGYHGVVEEVKPPAEKWKGRKGRKSKVSSKAERSKKYEDYRIRNEILEKVGFDSYKSYLESNTWHQIRSKILEDNTLCVCCKSRLATQVHHLDYSYETIIGEKLDGLIPVCKSCHQAAEVSEDGTKKSLAEANKFLLEGPPVMTLKETQKKRWMTISLSEDAIDRLNNICASNGCSISKAIEISLSLTKFEY